MCEAGGGGRGSCAETRGSSRRSWLDLAKALHCATGQLPSTLAEYGGSCLATVTMVLCGQERAAGGQGCSGGAGSGAGGGGGGRGALRDHSLQQCITAQLATPPKIHGCLATEPPPPSPSWGGEGGGVVCCFFLFSNTHELGDNTTVFKWQSVTKSSGLA